jgi:hypothetical protein
LVALDSLHNTKGHLSTVIKRLQKDSSWNETVFKELLEKHVQRRLVADLDGQHYRLLFSQWREVILPAIESTDASRREKLETLFHHWCEIQWIMHLPPEAQTNKGLRLRLHVLTFQHLQLCRQLFPDERKQTTRNSNTTINPNLLATLTPAQVATVNPSTLKRADVDELIRRIYPLKRAPSISTRRAGLKPMDLYKFAFHATGTVWSKLVKDDLCALLTEICQLPDLPTIPSSSLNPTASPARQETTPTTTQKRGHRTEKIDSIMNLYLHAVVSHLGDFYEVLDFKNTSTERGEAFLATMKHVVLRFTGRNFREAQTMREVLIRKLASCQSFVVRPHPRRPLVSVVPSTSMNFESYNSILEPTLN